MSYRSCDRIVLRTYCWVIVEAPSFIDPVARSMASARAMLLAAAVLDAASLCERGFLHHVHEDHELAQQAQMLTQRIASLAPLAARINKQSFRALQVPLGVSDLASAATRGTENPAASAYDYAASPEHREGIDAFLSKRKPVF